MPTFKSLLSQGELVRVFALNRIPHPIVVDLFALAGGYHGFWIDQEHAGMTVEQISTASLAARANGFDCFVRMAPTGYSQVTQNLECGVGGVMAAQIQSADHARQFVQWTKFAPRGVRGINNSGRDANFTHKPMAQFAADANRDGLVAIQIEVPSAVAAADEIAAIDGVDLLFIGPADLSLALGIVGQFQHEKLWEAIDQVAAACRKHGKHWGVVPFDPAFAQRAVEHGCRMLTFGNEVLTLRRGIEAIKSAYAAQF